MFNLFSFFCLQELFLFLLTMQSYDGFWLIPNFFFHFFSKALDKEPGFGQNGSGDGPLICSSLRISRRVQESSLF